MSFRTGDRARAHKKANKRRVRRSEMQVFKRLTTPGENHRVAGAEVKDRDSTDKAGVLEVPSAS